MKLAARTANLEEKIARCQDKSIRRIAGQIVFQQFIKRPARTEIAGARLKSKSQGRYGVWIYRSERCDWNGLKIDGDRCLPDV
ncbi:hypothetical protein [Afipia sp. OHSU_I-C6]|uniref:hypothetical protein n=1 Tax=Afipia sp. OHSU_I-C6 TaxID=1297864 RepID=UPI001FCC4555|nr:hypothetical protein [Afipia sp. OHSU_I-C6]